MNYLKIDPTSISNGPGVRVALFVSGCRRHCKGCFQPETWDFKAGQLFTTLALEEIISLVRKPFIQGLTILGGEPMEPENQGLILLLVSCMKACLPQKDIWLYSGYELEEMPKTQFTEHILKHIDVLVDGPYIEEESDPSLVFKGSKNQRIRVLNPSYKTDDLDIWRES